MRGNEGVLGFELGPHSKLETQNFQYLDSFPADKCKYISYVSHTRKPLVVPAS